MMFESQKSAPFGALFLLPKGFEYVRIRALQRHVAAVYYGQKLSGAADRKQPLHESRLGEALI